VTSGDYQSRASSAPLQENEAMSDVGSEEAPSLLASMNPRARPMHFLNVLAPRLTKRRLLLQVLFDFVRRPASIFGRLAPINFHNAKVCSGLEMHCPICGHDTGMTYDFPDVHLRRAHGIGLLRETLHCKSCGASMRDRQMAIGLLLVIAQRLGQSERDLQAYRKRPHGNLTILDTDSFSSINRVMRGMPGYTHSQFRPELRNGDILPDGSTNVNLVDIPFQTGNFDVIMTSDVMEHVAEDERAHREIFRCLAANGTYIFTVPYDPCLMGNRKLTQRTSKATPHFFIEKQVHGDPHASSGIIAYRIYGQQLIDGLREIGYEVRFDEIENPAQGIFGGDLFLARKRS
jgi:SAM-dependent methyltransferase